MESVMELKIIDSFNPAQMIEPGWSIWRGPKDGNGLVGHKGRYRKEKKITRVDWNKVSFETMIEPGEKNLSGEEMLWRFKEANVKLLGGEAFLSLWQDYCANKENSVLKRLQKMHNLSYIDFLGTVFRSPSPIGQRYVLFMWSGGRCINWNWRYRWLGSVWDAKSFSAILGC